MFCFTQHMQYLIVFCSPPEAASDVTSGRFVGLIVPDKCVKLSSLKPFLKNSTQRHRMRHFRSFFELDKCRPEAARDIIGRIFVGPIVPDKRATFRDPCLSNSQEIPPEAVACGILDGFPL